ncbi:epimerase [Actinoplanes sp. LDG1-06]|uniref:Epimerase n=1 Tax=Paractinoplanes ovalisporus TaxID=2810368 RepID=A0ABS2AJ02_9ACTN|nr:epimerase [Actinoplanes ovalisporus]MBM2619832.1 epimerase [Actinoplanes ovalisporus]
MKIVIFGASGVIGDGFLRESLHAADVTEVVAVGRSPLDVTDPKLRQVVHDDFTPIAGELAGADACFWGLGVSAVGMSPEDYERITFDYTMAAARTLASINPDLTFVYVSGGGTNPDGRARWARVKGRIENEIIAMFPNGYALRPGFVRPMHGRDSKTRMYRLATPLFPAIAFLVGLLRLTPVLMTSTTQMGQVALQLARHGYPRHVLENRDIVAADQAGRRGR